jgi:hypothetical protein
MFLEEACADANPWMTVSGSDLIIVESHIRDWLARLNDLCRIATFFYTSKVLAAGNALEDDCPDPPGALRVLNVLHSESFLCGAWALLFGRTG